MKPAAGVTPAGLKPPQSPRISGALRSATLASCVSDDGAVLTSAVLLHSVRVEHDSLGADLESVRFADCDLTDALFDHARMESVDLRSSTLDNITSPLSLRGATISVEQAIGLGPSLAAAAGLIIAVDAS